MSGSLENERVLTDGEWSALLYQCPDQTRPLLVRLAVHHGAMKPPRADEPCPACGRQTELGPVFEEEPCGEVRR